MGSRKLADENKRLGIKKLLAENTTISFFTISIIMITTALYCKLSSLKNNGYELFRCGEAARMRGRVGTGRLLFFRLLKIIN